MDADEPTRFQLVVEVKIDSAPGPDQFLRYLRDGRIAQATAGGVLALTKHPLGIDDLPTTVREHPKWSGHVRWHTLLPELLRRVPENPTTETIAWAALLRRAAEPGDLGAALPDWPDIAAATGDAARQFRATVLRAAAQEILAEVDDRRGPPAKIARRGEAVRFSVGSGNPVHAIEMRLRGTTEPSVDVRFWPPSPPPRRRRWEEDISSLIRRGWSVDGDHLARTSLPIADKAVPLHVATAAVLSAAVAPLRPRLLPRYWALSAPASATARDLEPFAPKRRRGPRGTKS